MTTLAANSPRAYELGDRNELPVIAADIIYEGAAVGDNGSGYARPLTAGDPFRGFAEAKADNAAGAAGDVRVRVLKKGSIQLAVGSLAITDVGKAVYASDDDTFTLTQSTNSHVGRVERFVSTGIGVVAFDASSGAFGAITELTDSSGGTPSDTIVDVPGAYAEATLANQLASLTAKVNALIRMAR